jgi:hypothetical protein
VEQPAARRLIGDGKSFLPQQESNLRLPYLLDACASLFSCMIVVSYGPTRGIRQSELSFATLLSADCSCIHSTPRPQTFGTPVNRIRYLVYHALTNTTCDAQRESVPFQDLLSRLWEARFSTTACLSPQRLAIQAFLEGRSVVCCAPTGSGKTLIAEAAAAAVLARGKRILYTTPLKALSNQKLRDFREKFGEENVGLVTGDASVNREAPVLVMTTEILRNMLYSSVGAPEGFANK